MMNNPGSRFTPQGWHLRDEVFGIRAHLGRSHDPLVQGRGERELGSAVANKVRELFDVRSKFAWVRRVTVVLCTLQR